METITNEAAGNQRGMSRRGFISGAALGTMALLGLAGCAQPNQTNTQKESEPSNQDAQAPATPDNVSETLECDIVVVGAGHLGTRRSRASLRERQQGSRS